MTLSQIIARNQKFDVEVPKGYRRYEIVIEDGRIKYMHRKDTIHENDDIREIAKRVNNQ